MAVASSIILGPTTAVMMVINQRCFCVHMWWGLCVYPSLCSFHALTEPWAASVFVVLICCMGGTWRVLMWWTHVLALSSFQLMILQQVSNNSVCYCTWCVQPKRWPGVNLKWNCGAFRSNVASSYIKQILKHTGRVTVPVSCRIHM